MAATHSVWQGPRRLCEICQRPASTVITNPAVLGSPALFACGDPNHVAALSAAADGATEIDFTTLAPAVAVPPAAVAVVPATAVAPTPQQQRDLAVRHPTLPGSQHYPLAVLRQHQTYWRKRAEEWYRKRDKLAAELSWELSQEFMALADRLEIEETNADAQFFTYGDVHLQREENQ